MKRPLVCMGVLFVLGELAYRLLEEGVIYSAAALIIGILICKLSNKLSSKSTPSRCPDLLLFCLFFVGVMWAFGYYSGKGNVSFEDKMTKGETLELTFYINASGIAEDIYSKELFYGDFGEPGTYVRVRGKLTDIPGSTNPGGFDMERYYAGKGIRYKLEPFETVHLEKPKNHLVNGLYHIKLRMANRIDIAFSKLNSKVEIIDGEMGNNLDSQKDIDGTYDEEDSKDIERDKYTEGKKEINESEDAAVIKTMLLGDKSDLSSETKILYQRSGIIHILAISGLHIGLLAGILEWLLERLRVRKSIAVVIVILLAVVYGVMTGFSDATLRAVLMLTIGRIAFLLGRSPDMPTSMIEALLIMVIHNPDSLFSTGMLMSYMAVLGVITGEMINHHIFDRRSFKFLKKKQKARVKGFAEGVVISMSINLWMMPLIMHTYYEVPIFSLILNLIIIPLLTIVVALGFVTALLGPYSLPFAWACHMLLSFYRSLCHFFISLPGSIIITGHVEMWQMALMYLLIATSIVSIHLLLTNKKDEIAKWFEDCNKDPQEIIIDTTKLARKRTRNTLSDILNPNELKRTIKRLKRKYIGWRSYVMAGVCALFLFVSFISIAGIKVANSISCGITFLDVGQGDGSIIRSKGKCYLVDGGSTSNDKVGQYTMIPALKYYGVSHVDLALISHMDLDHMNGLAYLLENEELYGIDVDCVAVSRGTEVDENYSRIIKATGAVDAIGTLEKTSTMDETQNKANKENIDIIGSIDKTRSKDKITKIIELGAGDVVDDQLYVLYPTGFEDIEHSGNDYSLVFDYRGMDTEILYTGDISSEVEAGIIEAMNDTRYLDWKDNHKVSISILKCPHHGSRYSSCDSFLESYSPDITVISCGRYNNYGHPAQETLSRLANINTHIYRTDQTGAVIIKSTDFSLNLQINDQ